MSGLAWMLGTYETRFRPRTELLLTVYGCIGAAVRSVFDDVLQSNFSGSNFSRKVETYSRHG